MKRIALSIALFFVSLSSFASGHVHTWHIITSQNGNWHGTLKTINEGASFVAGDGITALTTFSVSPQTPLKYGFIFDAGDDFDVAYTLTMTQDDTKMFSSKACVFVVTASSPANPDIRPVSFNGAKCDYKVVHGVGEDFSVG